MNWRYLILAFTSLLVLGLGDNIRGPLFAEILAGFKLSNFQGSLIFSASSICGFLGSLLIRKKFEKWGAVRVLNFSLVGFGVALALMGSAGSFAWFLFGSSLFGLSVGAMGVSQNYLVSVGASSHRLQQAMSGLHSMYGIASFMAPLMVAALSKDGDWRLSFLVVALFPLALAVINIFVGIKYKVVGSSTTETTASASPSSSRVHFYFAVGLALYVAAEILLSTRLALYMRRQFSYDLSQSSLYVSYFFAFLLAGRVLFSVVKFPFKLYNQIRWLLVLSVICYIAGLYLHPFFLVLTGLMMAPIYPLMMTYASQIFHREVLSRVIAICLSMSSLFIVFMNFSVGAMSDTWGILVAMLFGVLVLVLSLLSLQLLPFVLHKWTHPK